MTALNKKTTERIKQAIDALYECQEYKDSGITITEFLDLAGCDLKTLRFRPNLHAELIRFQEKYPTRKERNRQQRIQNCIDEINSFAATKSKFAILDLMAKHGLKNDTYQTNDKIYEAYQKALRGTGSDCLPSGQPRKEKTIRSAYAHIKLRGRMQLENILVACGIDMTDYNKGVLLRWLEESPLFEYSKVVNPQTNKVYKIEFRLADQSVGKVA
jgi:hypothetical protein